MKKLLCLLFAAVCCVFVSFAQTVSMVFSGTGPEKVHMDAAGNSYFVTWSTLYKKDPLNNVTTLKTGGSLFADMAMDSQGNIYLTDDNTNTVYKILPNGTSSVFTTQVPVPESIVIDPSGNIYVAAYSQSSIYKVAQNGTATLFAALGSSRAVQLSCDAAGNIYCATAYDGGLYKITPAGAITHLYTFSGYAYGCAVAPDGWIYASIHFNNTIVRYHPVTNTLQTVAGAVFFNQPTKLFLSNAGDLYVGNRGGGDFKKISGVYTPIPANGLDLWLKADAGVNTSGSTVTSWNDQSSNNRNAVATAGPAGGPQLVTNVVNGKPVVRLNGFSGSGLTTSSFASFPNQRGTIFVVSKSNGASSSSGAGYGTLASTYTGSGTTWQFGNYPGGFGFYDGVGSSNASLGTSAPTTWGITTLLRDANTVMKLFRNGSLDASLTIANNQPSINPLKIGWNGSQEVLNGDIAEILVYSYDLSPSQRDSVDQYLTAKYNIAFAGPVAAGALNFDGTNDCVTIPNAATVQLNTGTIEAWIKTTSPGSSYRAVICKQLAYALFVKDNMLMTYDWLTRTDISTNLNVADGNWHHIAMSFSNGVSNGSKIYLDGSLALTFTYHINSQSERLLLGQGGDPATYGGGVQNFNGSIEEVRIWNRVVCQQELQNNKNCELTGSQNGLVAYYKLNQGFVNASNPGVTTMADAGNSLNGSLVSFALAGSTSNWVAGNISGSCGAFTGTCPGAQAPIIAVNPSAIDFGNLGNGFSLRETVIVSNTGNANLNISSVVSSNPNYTVLYYKSVLTPGDTTQLQLKYQPLGTGASSGTVTIQHNAAAGSTAISVLGNSVATGFTYNTHFLPGFSGILHGASWFNGLKGFVTGANGKIYKTLDGGTTWTLVPFSGTLTLRSVRYIGPDLWLFGDNGHICVSHDDGQTFTSFNTGTSNGFYDAHFVNANYGFAVGANGTICRYNGTWQPYSLSLTNTFYGVYTYGTKAWAVGSGGIVCRYNYSSNSWGPINPGVTNDFYGVGFWDENIGYIVGSGGIICKTTNGGTNWSPLNSGVNVNIRNIRCFSANVAWACCENGMILQTTDGGTTWVKLPLGNFNFSRVDFNGCNGIAICHNGAVVTFQTNLCNNAYNPYYSRRYLGSPYAMYGACFTSRNTGGICGGYGSVFITGNGGQSWTSSNTNTLSDIRCLRIFGNKAFICGGNGYIAHCNNLGTNWQTFTGLPSGVTFYSMAFYANGTGWVVGSGGTICYYNGTSWVPYTTGVSNDFRCVYVIGNIAYACGTNGIVWKYNGTAWVNVSPGVSNDFYACAFVNANVGYAVGANGIVCKTTNGGQSWFPITGPCGCHLYSVKVGCLYEVMVVGADGNAYQSTNGGTSWTSRNLGLGTDLNGLDLSGGAGYITGAEGSAYAFEFGSDTLTASISANGPKTFCAGSSVTLTAAGGTNYLWSNSATTASTAIQTAGAYSVTVSDALGCEATASETITVNPNPVVTITPDGPTEFCSGGSVTLSAGGATSYAWNDAASSTASSIVVTSSGSLVVTGTDANSCASTASVPVVVNPLPVPTISAGGPITFCDGNSVTLTASLNTGGSYQWNKNAVPISGATNQTYVATTSGDYTVTEVNTNSCEARSAVTTVTVNPNPEVTVTASGATSFCDGGSVTLTANSATATSYLWSNNSTATAISPTTSGNYTVQVTDVNNCTATSAASLVTVYPLPTVTIAASGSTTFCSGGSVTLTGNGALNYSWNTNASTAGIVANTSGTYTVTGTDNNGCMNTASTTVTVNPLPVLAASISSTSAVDNCSSNTIYVGYGAQSLNLSIAPATGGTLPFTYFWTPAASVTSTAVSSSSVTATVSPTTSTTYTVTVTDANGCSATKDALVRVRDVRCGTNNDKVQVCHNNGGTNGSVAICVSPSAVPAHLSQHGDCLGDCTNSSARASGNVTNHMILEEGSIVVFPNPAHGRISVGLKEIGSPYRSYQISDINGRVVISRRLNGDVHADLISVDISGLAPGIYIFRAVADRGTGVVRFVVD